MSESESESQPESDHLKDRQTPPLILLRRGTLISRIGSSNPPITTYLGGDIVILSRLVPGGAGEEGKEGEEGEEDGDGNSPRYHFTIGRHTYTCPASSAILLEPRAASHSQESR